MINPGISISRGARIIDVPQISTEFVISDRSVSCMKETPVFHKPRGFNSALIPWPKRLTLLSFALIISFVPRPVWIGVFSGQ